MGLPSKPLPSQSELLEIFSYDKKSGKVFYIKSTNYNAPVGKEAGCFSRGYLVVALRGNLYFLHRLIWRMVTGDDPGSLEVDHKNENKSDNSWSNLRLSTHVQNNLNTSKRKDNTSSVKGVSWHKAGKAWTAYVTFNRKHHYLGLFPSKEQAEECVREYRQNLHGEFTNHG